MRKHAYFASRDIEGWPKPKEIEHYFLASPGKRWFFETRNDSAGFSADGVEGTGHLELENGRIDIWLRLWGHPKLGVLLIWTKSGGGLRYAYSSRGDLSKLRKWVRTTHGDPMPVGLYIPYDKAWKAVKEFLETDGDLPKSIEWIANRDLPENTFPDPRDVP